MDLAGKQRYLTYNENKIGVNKQNGKVRGPSMLKGNHVIENIIRV